MKRLITIAAVWLVIAAGALRAQSEDVVFVQIEAQPTLAQAQTAARNYAAKLDDVNGFDIGGGWYAVALGPYRRIDAEQVLRAFRAEGSIPRDSFVALPGTYRQQFWPIGGAALAPAVTSQPVVPAATPEPVAPVATPESLSPPEAEQDETEREARNSEAALSRQEREALQVALKWAGHYTGAIDGAFGRGTRSSMANWQAANGYSVTGVMTTKQRAALVGAYNAILDGLDLQIVRDEAAGVEMAMPKALVAFSKYEPPFAHYDSIGDIPARVLLISQEGDQATLFGLYDILQTLSIIPPEGARSRDNSGFYLVGEGKDFISHTEAKLQNGEIKGFTLIWPAGDEERRTRLLGEMQASFTRLPGTIDPAMLSASGQSVDLVAGLKIRKPKLTRSGVFVDEVGRVATVRDAVEGCARITLDDEVEAKVLLSDAASGVALLEPLTALAPRGVAEVAAGEARLQSEVAAAGYSYGAALDRPTLTFGRVADVRGLSGEEEITRLDLDALPEDAGGPVLDGAGAVIGLLVPPATGARQLPATVAYVLEGAALGQVLAPAGITLRASRDTEQLAAVDLTSKGETMTVLVSCWAE